MKRLTTLMLALLVGLSWALLLPGCGGTKGEARASMKKGDEIVVVIEKDSETLVGKIDSTFSGLYKEINSGKTPNAGAFDKSSKEITTLAHKMSDKASQAKAQYEKIGRLKGVPDYAKYADLKIKIIDANVQGLKQLDSFLGQEKDRLSAKPFDPVAFQIAVIQFSDSLKNIGEETGKLQKQAEDLKKQKKL